MYKHYEDKKCVTTEVGKVGSRPSTSQCIDWYSEGETRIVRIGKIEVRVRFVGRRGRRGRIVVEAPAGAVFQSEGFSRLPEFKAQLPTDQSVPQPPPD